LKSLDEAKKTNIKDSIEEEHFLFCKYKKIATNNHEKVPILSKLVKCVYCSPPTSVPSDRDFLMGTDIVKEINYPRRE
jgi:hypothetical protein